MVVQDPTVGGVDSVLQPFDLFEDTAFGERFSHALRVLFEVEDDIVSDRHVKKLIILEHHGEPPAVFGERVGRNIDSAEQNFSLGGLVEPAEQLYKCRFAGTVVADDRQPLPRFYLNVYVFKDIAVGVRIFEGYVYEFDVAVLGKRGDVGGFKLLSLMLRTAQEFPVVVDVFREQSERGEAFNEFVEGSGERG